MRGRELPKSFSSGLKASVSLPMRTARESIRRSKRSSQLESKGSRPKGYLAFLCLLGHFVVSAGCGYRVAGAVKGLPDGVHSLGIPTFRNSTNQYRLEQ